MERTAASDKFPIGTQLPRFSLTDTNGLTITDEYLRAGKVALVVFSCNHCPYVKGSESRLIELVRRYEPQGLRAVSINSNDPVNYPEDSFDKMREKAVSMRLPYPYLFDETQRVAKNFDAACTPECYLFDSSGSLIFHGTINDNPKNSAAAKKGFLEQALEQAFKGEMPEPSFIHPVGCSIKWKTS